MNWMAMNHAMLPYAPSLPLWIKLSWALVLSAVVLRMCVRAHPSAPSTANRRKGLAAAVAALVLLLPSHLLSGYLALAFQTPSVVLVVWAACAWWGLVWPAQLPADSDTAHVRRVPVALVGALLGWALVVDTLNAWPAFFNPQLYALGFKAAGFWLVLGITAALLLWTRPSPRWTLSAVAVLTVYVLLRWPTGNVWDAVLDPFVWLACHVQLWCGWREWRRERGQG